MINLSFTFIIWTSYLSGFTICKEVLQTPADVLCPPDTNVNLTCSHEITNYNTILWYQRAHGDTSLKLIGYAYSRTSKRFEKEFEDGYKMDGDGSSSVSLLFQARLVEDSVMYFCAAYSGQGEGYPAIFGNGTKLTVLDPGAEITPPKVKIFKPSETEECKKFRLTLVCWATGFYPDHVNVSWKVDGVEQTSGIATDNAASPEPNKNQPFYRITSRLSTTHRTWNEGLVYTCTVSFYNGTGTDYISDSIKGPEGITVKYLKTARLTVVAYGGMICKSLVYCLFILFIIKRQVREKRDTMLSVKPHTRVLLGLEPCSADPTVWDSLQVHLLQKINSENDLMNNNFIFVESV